MLSNICLLGWDPSSPCSFPQNCQLKMSKTKLRISSWFSAKFFNQNLKQIGPRVPDLWSDKQTDKQRLQLYIFHNHIYEFTKTLILWNAQTWDNLGKLRSFNIVTRYGWLFDFCICRLWYWAVPEKGWILVDLCSEKIFAWHEPSGFRHWRILRIHSQGLQSLLGTWWISFYLTQETFFLNILRFSFILNRNVQWLPKKEPEFSCVTLLKELF